MTSDVHRRMEGGSGHRTGWFGWRSGSAVLACCVFLSLVKLALVANHEIVGVLRPHDDLWHIRAALQWVWGRPFNEMTLVHLPTYAIYVATSGALGVPLRISIEIVYLCCAALLAISLNRLGLRRTLQVFLFALLAFHPFIYEGLDFALPEMLYTCLVLAFVGLFIHLTVPVSRSDLFLSAVLFASTSALMWYLRKESILVEALFALIALGIAAAWILKFIRRNEALGLAGRLVVGPLTAVLLLGMTISTANGLRYGLWATDQLSAPNYVRMFSSLLAIRPDHPIRFVSVTRDSREKAYAVSPAFRELQPFLDGDNEHWTARISRTLGMARGEIGAGWFYWALIDTVTAAGHFGTPSDAEAFYGRVADEIQAAQKDGRLPYRRALLPYVDPNFSVWLPYLPASTMTLAKSLFPLGPAAFPDRTESTLPDVVGTYDLVAFRRATLVSVPQFKARGWITSSIGRPLRIQIIGEDDQDIASHFEAMPRMDLKPIIGQDLRPGPDPLGFDVSWPAVGSGSVRFKVLMEGNRSATSEPIDKLPLGVVIRLLSAEPDAQVFLAVDRLEKPLPAKRTAIVRSLNAVYPFLLGLFSAIGLIYFLYLVVQRDLVVGLHGLILLFVLAVISSRVLFFAILDASAWSAEQTRYLLPAAILLPVIPAILLAFRRRSREINAP
jgi:hypothetical protein